MENRVKIGIVGIGAISGIYLKNITQCFKELELAAVCDLIKERAQKAKDEYGVPKIYDTMHELFADKEIDIVLNLTRPYEHYEVTKAALLAGKHVYSEKPLAADLAEGTELAELAKEKGLMLGGAPDTFLGAGIQTCRKLIDDGYIGDVLGGAAFMICRGHESWHPDPEFYYKRGGGPMLDMGPYYITALVNLLGGVTGVMGMTGAGFSKRVITSEPHYGEVIDVDVPTYITGMMRFENGAIATIFTTFDVCYEGSARLEIYGTKGTIIAPDPNTFGGPVKLIRAEDSQVHTIPLCFDYAENSRALGLADMAKALRTGRAARESYVQTYHVLEIMESFQKSSESGMLIPIKSKYHREAPMKNNPLHGFLD